MYSSTHGRTHGSKHANTPDPKLVFSANMNVIVLDVKQKEMHAEAMVVKLREEVEEVSKGGKSENRRWR